MRSVGHFSPHEKKRVLSAECQVEEKKPSHTYTIIQESPKESDGSQDWSASLPARETVESATIICSVLNSTKLSLNTRARLLFSRR